MSVEQIVHQGRKYELQPFENESELEQVVLRRANEIFGQKTVFFNAKKLVGSPGDVLKTIPDGYLLDLSGQAELDQNRAKLDGKKPVLQLVEVELATHDAYRHIMVQLAKFSELDAGSRLKIRNLLQAEIRKNKQVKKQIERFSDEKEVLQAVDEALLQDVKSPLASLVVIDKVNPRLKQALTKLVHRPGLLEVKRYRSSKGENFLKISRLEKPKVGSTLPDQNEDKEEDNSFDFEIRSIENELIVLSDSKYRYIDKCVYIPRRNFSHPIKFSLDTNNSEADLKVIKLERYRTISAGNNKNDMWEKKLEVETNFNSPVQIGKPLTSCVEVEVTSDNLPPHLARYTLAPIMGNIKLTVDYSHLVERPNLVKLLEFVSLSASRPIIPASLSPVKKVNKNGKVSWNIKGAKKGHHYVILWNEPCDCSWCRHKVLT